MKHLRLAILAILLLLPVCASGDTLHVSPDGMSLTAALEMCEDGDVIELADGLYTEDRESYPLCVTKAVTISAAEGAQPVLDAPAFVAALRIEADGVRVCGLEIHMRRTGIYAIGNDMTVENCRIVLAEEKWRTSSCGMWMGGIRNAVIRNCSFEGCSISMAGPPLSESSKGLPVLTGLFEVGETPEYFVTHTIEGCTVNEKPLFYAVNQERVAVPSEVGQIICAGCREVVIQDADTSSASMGMILLYNDHVLIERSKADQCGVFGIYVAKCGSGILRDCSTDGTNHGIDIRACQRIVLDSCTATNCDQGLFFSFVSNSMMVDCLVENTGQGYFSAGGENNVFLHCRAVACENGFNLQKEGLCVVAECTIEDCSVCGVRLDWTPASFLNNTVRNNWVGVMAYGDVSFRLLGNTFSGNQGCGLYLRDIAFSHFSGNAFSEHAKASVEAYGAMCDSLWHDNLLDIPAVLRDGALLTE